MEGQSLGSHAVEAVWPKNNHSKITIFGQEKEEVEGISEKAIKIMTFEAMVEAESLGSYPVEAVLQFL